MTDIRETQNYETSLQEGPGDLRETQAYVYALGTPPSSDERETQAYFFALATPPSSDERETQAYFTASMEGEDELRESLAYFWVLGNVGLPQMCAFLSVIQPGPAALAADIDPGPVARTSTFGPIGESL